MTALSLIALILALLAICYLGYVIIRPERF